MLSRIRELKRGDEVKLVKNNSPVTKAVSFKRMTREIVYRA